MRVAVERAETRYPRGLAIGILTSAIHTCTGGAGGGVMGRDFDRLLVHSYWTREREREREVLSGMCLWHRRQ